jgi:hypothetical protein
MCNRGDFKLPKDLYRSEWKYSTTFHFKISDDGEPYEDAKLTVAVNSFSDVEVKTNRPSNQSAQECPTSEEAEPPAATQTGDLVTLSRSGCCSTCPAYDVTVSDSSKVAWNGTLCVQSKGSRHSKIDPAQAHALIEQFLLPEFWALCKGYSRSITDTSIRQIAVQIGGRTKTVRNYASSAPPWIESFKDAIDSAANTHLWRHGEPKTEPLANIIQDGYMPKPGVTPLMRAAMRSDIDSMKAAIARRDDVDAQDSSGWTALMYAAASSHSEPVQLLLDAGANPNHKSFSGDTTLMSSAISGQFDEDLFHARAEVNATNKDDTTVLMILAARVKQMRSKRRSRQAQMLPSKTPEGVLRSIISNSRTAAKVQSGNGIWMTQAASATTPTRMTCGTLPTL